MLMILTIKLENCLAYAQDHWDSFLEDFKELLRIPTVSADPAFQADVRRTAEWILAEMKRIGLHNCQLLESSGHPAVYGEWLEAGDDKPTVLMYAHYDTQPVDPLEKWITPPFEPSERDGWLYARGAIDDKCGVHIHLKTVESILSVTGKLPINVKFFFEGEEECGSTSVAGVIHEQKSLLKADLLVISDGGCIGEQPFVIASTRGIVSTEVKVSGPVKDLHSGRYGGVVCNPAHIAAKIVAGIHCADGKIQIPGFYDDVKPLSSTELDFLAGQEDDIMEIARQDTGLDEFWGVQGYSFIECQTALPTFDVHGFQSGYQGVGTKTIIPAEASFKASMRLAADQDPVDIAAKFVSYVKSFEKPGIQIEIKTHAESRAVQCLINGPVLDAIQKAYDKTYGRRAILYRQGGSVPVMSTLQKELIIPITNLGFGNGVSHHSPNEGVCLKFLKVDLDTAIRFYFNMADVKIKDINIH
jgi:acetylornithine deacetylase/succinyl-diaminopimelate desuccinylase-like protein